MSTGALTVFDSASDLSSIKFLEAEDGQSVTFVDDLIDPTVRIRFLKSLSGSGAEGFYTSFVATDGDGEELASGDYWVVEADLAAAVSGTASDVLAALTANLTTIVLAPMKSADLVTLKA
jgi:hypothetical protein